MCDHEDAPEGVCKSCHARCLAVWRDDGIGPYEYWGSREVHEDWHWVSPCCGFDVVSQIGEDEE